MSTTSWTDPCWLCGGPGELSYGAAARLLGENPSTFSRFRQGCRPDAKMRCKPETVLRIIGKIDKLLYPRGQKEMFR